MTDVEMPDMFDRLAEEAERWASQFPRSPSSPCRVTGRCPVRIRRGTSRVTMQDFKVASIHIDDAWFSESLRPDADRAGGEGRGERSARRVLGAGAPGGQGPSARRWARSPPGSRLSVGSRPRSRTPWRDWRPTNERRRLHPVGVAEGRQCVRAGRRRSRQRRRDSPVRAGRPDRLRQEVYLSTRP